MNDKELIELIKFTAFEMLMPQKISDEDAESILKDYKEAINYTPCCKSDSEQLRSTCGWCSGNNIDKNDELANRTDF